jgi:hydroxymethylpyrimidine pyrophosphatase-like HAD family hydrolase
MADASGFQTSTSESNPVRPESSPEELFYSAYEWSLNPVLSVRELFTRLRETLNHIEVLPPSWQREECKANLYLFISAITCTVDDYLGEGPLDLLRASRQFPRIRIPLLLMQKLVGAMYYCLSLPRKLCVARWRRRWTSCVDAACEILVTMTEPTAEQWQECKKSIAENIAFYLPKSLLNQHMTLPSGLRSQDLTHQDAIALGHLFAASQTDRQRRILIIGPRSMGAYLAPTVSAKLKALGWTSVAWCTLRPKNGISLWERSGLRGLASADVQVVVVDESPNTGNTFLLMLKLLQELGTDPRRIYLLAALHPARPNWDLPDSTDTRGVRLIRLEAHELHKNHLLEPASVQPLLREYFCSVGWLDVEVTQSQETDELNIRLAEHFQDGFQCRLKRVFDVRLKNYDQVYFTKRVLAKSVGWGWLAYHAYFSGKRLAGFVPQTLGLRNGILFMDWLDRVDADSSGMPSRPPIDHLAAYVATRVRDLRLPKDPCFEISIRYGWTGWSVLMGMLKKSFGRYLARARVKLPTLHRHLNQYVTPVPALIDGQMNPKDWVGTQSGHYKVDFEHHNFGRTELYIVDAAYDLACAVFEFHLSEHEEQQLVQSYVRSTGDYSVANRILLWKLVHGEVLRGQAIAVMSHEKRSEVVQRWHERSFLARNFLVYEMNRFSASLLPAPLPAKWTKRLFFMDLDGVFDSDIFGFPQTTRSGLVALAMLQAHGFSVILNTARSAKDVQQYCQAYRLPGGLAESGCIFVDAVAQREFLLVDEVSAEQLKRCKEAIQTLTGAFVDLNYRTAIRAFRNVGHRTEGLSATEVQRLLDTHALDWLTYIPTDVDTTIVPKGIGKGPSLLWVKSYLELKNEPVAAVGDNDQDLEMLRTAEVAYAPANSSEIIRKLATIGQCKLTRQKSQKGLLEAARHVIHPDGRSCDKCSIQLSRAEGCGALIQTLTDFAERSGVLQFLSVLNWRGL